MQIQGFGTPYLANAWNSYGLTRKYLQQVPAAKSPQVSVDGDTVIISEAARLRSQALKKIRPYRIHPDGTGLEFADSS